MGITIWSRSGYLESGTSANEPPRMMLLLLVFIGVAVTAGLRFAYSLGRRDMARDLYIDEYGEDDYHDLMRRFGL